MCHWEPAFLEYISKIVGNIHLLFTYKMGHQELFPFPWHANKIGARLRGNAGGGVWNGQRPPHLCGVANWYQLWGTFKELKLDLVYDPAVSTGTLPQRHSHGPAHGGATHNSQEVPTAWMPFHWWMGNGNVLHTQWDTIQLRRKLKPGDL